MKPSKIIPLTLTFLLSPLISGIVIGQTCVTDTLDHRVAEFIKNHEPAYASGQLSIDDLRKNGPTVFARLPDDSVKRVAIGSGGLRVNVLNASNGNNLPVIINFHPGGFVVPLQPWMEYEALDLSRRFNAVVFDVDYRVGPEHKHPSATVDAWTAFEWVIEHAKEYGGDPTRIIVKGTEAGATLAAQVMHRAKREKRMDALRLVMMICPAVDNPMISYYPSQDAYSTGYLRTRDQVIFSVQQYFDKPDWYHTSAHIWPIYESDLEGLPPVLILTTEFDMLRDEGIAYGKKLEAAGVAVSIKCFPHQIHGFIGLPHTSGEVQRAYQLMGEAIVNALGE